MDVGAAIIYVIVFAGLFLSQAGLAFGVDRWLTPKLGRWGWIASGPCWPRSAIRSGLSVWCTSPGRTVKDPRAP